MPYYDKKYPFRKYAFHYFCEWVPEDFDRARQRVAGMIVELMKSLK